MSKHASDDETIENTEAEEKTLMEEFDNFEETGNTDGIAKAIGNLFKNFNIYNNNTVDDSYDFAANLLNAAGIPISTEQIALAKREIEIETYFKTQLQTFGMEEAIKITKEKYDIPNDYTITIKMEISFNTNDKKAKDPNLD